MKDLEQGKFWLQQAALDLDTAEFNRDRYPAAACFYAQQAGEKAVKSLCYAVGLGKETRDAHLLSRLYELIKDLSQLQGILPLLEDVLLLDSFYMTTRYPDVWGNQAVPGKMFTVKQADEAIVAAKEILSPVTRFLAAAEKALAQEDDSAPGGGQPTG